MSIARMTSKGAGPTLIALALAGAARAQQPEARTEPAVVTATRTPVPAGGTIGSLGLVTPAQIEAVAAVDDKTPLALVPSLVLNDAGGPAGALRADFSYRPGGRWDVAGGVFTQRQTLLDHDHQTVEGCPMPGTIRFAGLQISL
jgi:hypothetical protein